MGAALAAALALGIALALAVPGAGGGGEPAARAAWERPNLIVITTDDQSLNQWSPDVMPRTFARLAQGDGTLATNAFAVPPLCCPARASLLTGSYPHNHGVVRNAYGLLRDKDSTLPVWLRRMGYRTAFIGKFMNGYDRRTGGATPAPGFDYWWAPVGRFDRYYEYEASENGEVVEFGDAPGDYLTTQINERAVELIHDAADGEQPLFAWISHLAPHSTPYPEHRDPYCRGPALLPGALDEAPAGGPPLRDRPVPHGPAFNEEDVSDKPKAIRELEPLTPDLEASVDRMVRCRWAALQEVDRGIDAIFQALEDAGQSERTVVVLFSDNGTFAGEHRIGAGKALPYEPTLRVPFAIWVPAAILGQAPVEELDGLVGTIDVAPTLLELAKARPCATSKRCRRMDGVSLVDPLRGGDGLRNRRLIFQVGGGCANFKAVRTKRFQYTEWLRRAPNAKAKRCRVAEREFYDLRTDPAMLNNGLADGSADEPLVQRADDLLERLSRCTGIRGRERRYRRRPFCG